MIFKKVKSNYPLESLRGIISGQQPSWSKTAQRGALRNHFWFPMEGAVPVTLETQWHK